MYYIAYGSNMNLSQMANRCPTAKIVGVGKLYGYNLVFNYHADVIKSKNEYDYVNVLVWDIENMKEWMTLDRYEGVPNYYVRRKVSVLMENGEKIDGIVYVMTGNRKGIYPPSYSYFKGIYDGYLDAKINTEKLFYAVDFSLKHDTKYNQYNPKE